MRLSLPLRLAAVLLALLASTLDADPAAGGPIDDPVSCTKTTRFWRWSATRW